MAAVADPFSTTLPAPLARGGCWPAPDQELLLRAALLPRPEALSAWRQWSQRHDLENDPIDTGSYRLLPTVFAHLRQELGGDAAGGRIEGLYKRHWYENQLAFAAGEQALAALQSAGIEAVLLKGWPLALRYYADIGARPMSDLDLMVPSNRALAAAGVLEGLGWHPDHGIAIGESTLSHTHSRGFQRPRGGELDLHWHALQLCQDEAVSRELREASVPLALHRVAAKTLCTSDHLLCVCLHGLMWSPVPPMRWVVDAMRLIASRDHPVDWERLLAMARAARGSLQLHAALDYLRERFQAPVPPELLQALEKTPATRFERELYTALTSAGNWRNARLLWLGYQARQAARGGAPWRIDEFLEHMRVAKDHRSRWQTLRWAGTRALQRLARQAWPRGSGGA